MAFPTREQMAANSARHIVDGLKGRWNAGFLKDLRYDLTWSYYCEATAKNDAQRAEAVTGRLHTNALILELTRAYNNLTIQQRNYLKSRRHPVGP